MTAPPTSYVVDGDDAIAYLRRLAAGRRLVTADLLASWDVCGIGLDTQVAVLSVGGVDSPQSEDEGVTGQSHD